MVRCSVFISTSCVMGCMLTCVLCAGAEFMLSLLQIAAIFNFTKELQDSILHE